jgi:hypothetical protein
MATTSPSGSIHERMAWLMDHLPVIQKRQVKAGNQSYKAFAIDDIYLQFHPHFATAGVFIMPHIHHVDYVTTTTAKGQIVTDARVIVDYTFYAPDGSHVAMRVAAEGRDYQDKATNKAVQQAIKYGLVQAFLQPTGEPDPDTQTVETSSGKDPGVSPTDKAWTRVVELFPDNPNDVWWQIRDSMGLAEKHMLTDKEAKILVKQAQQLAEQD